MAIESDIALLEVVRDLVADLEAGGDREGARLLRNALGGSVVSGEGKEGVRSALRKMRDAGTISGVGVRERIGDAIRYLDLVLGHEPQY